MKSLTTGPAAIAGSFLGLGRKPHALALRRSRPLPELTIDQEEDAGSHDLGRNVVHIALAMRNVDRGTASSYRVEARTRQDEEVGLLLPDPSRPGDATFRHQGEATFRHQGDNDIIEWQSTHPWPPQRSRLISFQITTPRDRRVLIGLKVLVPGIQPVRRRIEVAWSGVEPLIQVVVPL